MNPPGARKYQKLPTGWEYQTEANISNQSNLINQFGKSMAPLEQLRGRYQELQNERCSNESVTLQTPHSYGGSSAPVGVVGFGGSSHYIYPSNNMLAMSAFQHPSPSIQMTSSHALSSLTNKSQTEMSSPLIKGSQSMSTPHRGQLIRRSTIQETSFTNQMNTDLMVQKIQNMFPTASENHIRLLLKKYYNREAVVISALQVEKYPVTMPGPFVTPPSERHVFHNQLPPYGLSGNYSLYGNQSVTPHRFNVTEGSLNSFSGLGFGYGYGLGGTHSRNTSPLPRLYYNAHNNESFTNDLNCNASIVNYGGHGSTHFGEHLYPLPVRSHSSPKMKLKYLKIVFPQVEETLLLHLLANADNNVQKATEELILLGYTKRELSPPPPPPSSSYATTATQSLPSDKRLTGSQLENANTPNSKRKAAAASASSRTKKYSEEEKLQIKVKLCEAYPTISEHVIIMALETVNYREERARQILQIVHEEELERKNKKAKGDCKKEVRQQMQAGNPLVMINDEQCRSSLSSTDNKNDCESFTMKRPIADNNTQISSSPSSLLSKSSLCSSSLSSPSSSPFSSSNFLSTNRSILTKYGLNNQMATTSPRPFIGLLRNSQSNDSNNDNIYHHHHLYQYPPFNNQQQRSKLSIPKRTLTTSTMDNLCQEFKSRLGRTSANGPNAQLYHGANEKLLLADYMTWNGANPNYLEGRQQNMAVGSNPFLLHNNNNAKKTAKYQAFGHNADLCKGPQTNLAKGSIYAKGSPSTIALHG